MLFCHTSQTQTDGKANLEHTPAKNLQIFYNVFVAGRKSQRAQNSDKSPHVETARIWQDFIRQFQRKIIVWHFILMFRNSQKCHINNKVDK